ncbi:MAG: PilN domain-containing protein [Gemmatimonadetes bacterium]|nr:PilN domain-containing protein [Gemmatimonadota bacterium]
MIEINLLPGGKKAKRSAAASFDVRAFFSDLQGRFRDPWLITAIVGVVLGLGAAGFMMFRTGAREAALTEEEQKAVQDSVRFASVIRERDVALAQRDSIVRQLAIIGAIDGTRYVWPHVLDEVITALTPYTWLVSLQQTSAAPAVAPEVETGVSAGNKTPQQRQAEAEEAAAANTVTLRVVGQTADVQALTRFVRQLEDSPWLDDVQMARTETVLAQPSNKEVTQFTIDMRVARPDSSAIRRVPLTIGAR